MKTYNFTVGCKALDSGRDSDEIIDALYEAGCDDALVVERMGSFVLEFDREAPSLARALISALNDIIKAGLSPIRIGPDPLVSAADIAERSGLTRQAVSLYVSHQRGEDFPCPVFRFETNSPLWRWVDVASWPAIRKKLDYNEPQLARCVERANNVIVPVFIQRAEKDNQTRH